MELFITAGGSFAKGKKKKGNIRWIICSVQFTAHHTQAPWEPINSVTKNKQYSRCYHDCFVL